MTKVKPIPKLYFDLISHLGDLVITPRGVMRLTEIYWNGNVGCIPVDCSDYMKLLSEFHGDSLQFVENSPEL